MVPFEKKQKERIVKLESFTSPPILLSGPLEVFEKIIEPTLL